MPASSKFLSCLQPHFIARITTLVWIALLVYLAALPDLPRVPAGPVSQGTLSVAAHFSTYFLLATLLFLSAAPSKSLHSRIRNSLVAFGLSALLGLGLESLHAILPSRTFSVFDLTYNSVGAATGPGLILLIDRRAVDRRFTVAAAAVGTVILVSITIYGQAFWGPPLPKVGDSWWAPYIIGVCGERLPPLPASPGNIHTHGSGLIYVHPKTAGEAGSNATLSRFYSNSGGVLTDSSITLPSGETYANGDDCAGGTGVLLVLVNGLRINQPSSYVPRALYAVQFEFTRILSCPEDFLDWARCRIRRGLQR